MTNLDAAGLKALFPGRKVKVDPMFEKFFDVVSLEDTTDYISPWAHQRGSDIRCFKGDSLDEIFGPATAIAYGDDVWLADILKHLGGPDFDKLTVPEDEEEFNLVLGFALIDAELQVLFVEHELKGGKEEIHLHARPPAEFKEETFSYIARS